MCFYTPPKIAIQTVLALQPEHEDLSKPFEIAKAFRPCALSRSSLKLSGGAKIVHPTLGLSYISYTVPFHRLNIMLVDETEISHNTRIQGA